MSGVTQLATPKGRLRFVYEALQTGTSFTALAATATKPTDGVVAGVGLDSTFGGTEAGPAANVGKLVLLGTGAEDTTAAFRLSGYQQEVRTGLWIPQSLVQGVATLGAATVTYAGLTLRFADEIVLSTGMGLEGSSSVQVIAAGTDLFASVLCDLLDYQLLVVQVHRNGSATSVNAAFSAF